MDLDVTKELQRAGAVYLNKHFVYASGKHGAGYVNTDPLFPDVRLISRLCEAIAKPFEGEIETVIAPATGGIVLSVLAARALVDAGHDVNAVWADKTSDRQFALERAGFSENVRNKRVLVVEDLLNTGHSVQMVCRLVEDHGGVVAGVSVVADRGLVTAADLAVPRVASLATIEMQAIDAGSCPLCVDKVPIVQDIGHGDDYRRANSDYPGGFVKLLEN